MTPLPTKAGKRQFRCYHCKNFFGQKDGNWFHWHTAENTMQVFLCTPCEKKTNQGPERNPPKS